MLLYGSWRNNSSLAPENNPFFMTSCSDTKIQFKRLSGAIQKAGGNSKWHTPHNIEHRHLLSIYFAQVRIKCRQRIVIKLFAANCFYRERPELGILDNVLCGNENRPLGCGWDFLIILYHKRFNYISKQNNRKKVPSSYQFVRKFPDQCFIVLFQI